MKYPLTSKKSKIGVRRTITSTQKGHHAECLAPLKSALQDACDLSGLMHAAGSWKGGSNSPYIQFPNITFFFKGIPNKKNPRIVVKLRAKGPVFFTIKKEIDAFSLIHKYAR